MKKRCDLGIHRYISRNLKKGYSEPALRKHLLDCGFDEDYVAQQFHRVRKIKLVAYSSVSVFIVLLVLSIFLFKPSLTGFVTAVNSGKSYEGLAYSSAAYNPETGLIYQGLSQDGSEKISGASIQGKRRGSINILDYDNDGKADLFTTGFYTNNGKEIASTGLYKGMSQSTGSFIDVKYSDSCWADFDNDGWIEPVIIGFDSENTRKLSVYANDKGTFSLENYNLDGVSDGKVKCADFDGDGWVDIIVSGVLGDSPYLQLIKNNAGTLSLSTSFTGYSYSSILVNDFNKDGNLDFIVSGDTGNGYKTTLHTTDGNSFSSREIISNQMEEPSVISGDYDNDGNTDFLISGWEKTPKTLLFKNNGNDFTEEYIGLTNTYQGTILFLDSNNDNNLDIFLTGRKLDPTPVNYAELLYLNPETKNNLPSSPTNLSSEKLDETYLKFTWNKVQDDHTFYPFYNVRAGYDDSNPNKYLSGFLYDPKGNAQLTQFKLLKNPCLEQNLDTFFFQVQSIDGAYTQSEWSDKYYINCKPELNLTNTTINLTTVVNTTLPILNETIPEIIEQNLTLNEPSTWYYDRNFNNIKYHAQYERTEKYVTVTETVTNNDIYSHDSVTVLREERFKVIAENTFSLDKESRLTSSIGIMQPGDKKTFTFYLDSTNIKYNQVLPIQINSNTIIPELPVITQNLTTEITVEGNKTILTVDVELNESVIGAKDIYVKQNISKCLLEKINELMVQSGRVVSNKEFTILEEDPVIMWHFTNIVDAKELKLEIDAVASENCTNPVRTEIVAKKYLIQKDKVNPVKAWVLLFSVILITLPFYLFITNARTYNRKVAIFISLALIFALEILDTVGMLPASIDFLKKFLSWITMIALIYHISLKSTLFSGKSDKNDWLVNSLILISFIALSIKNITYVAFTSYAKEKLFGDLLLPLVLYSDILETWIFFSGVILIVLLTLYVIFSVELSAPSFSALIHRTEFNFLHAKWKKPFYVLLIFLGFYIAFFNFLFDWFSISFDAPLLILTLLLALYALMKHKNENIGEVPEKTDTFIQKFVNLFTHPKNVFIAFAAFPIMIFIIELYNYIAYILFGIKSIYFEGIELAMPTLYNANIPLNLFPLYLVQIGGLISAVLLAFLFWWHFFLQREDGTDALISDKPNHPLLFAVFISGLVAFLLKPVFDILVLKAECLSGLVIILTTASSSYLTVIYFIVSIVFVLSYLLFRDKKEANILPYAALLMTIVYVTILFISSFLNRINYGDMLSFTLSIKSINALFLFITSAIYLAVLAFSLYALIGEFLMLVREEFSDSKLYRRLMLMLYSHKVKLTDEQKKSLMDYMETMLEQGHEDYYIIEHIHKHTHWPIREISRALKELEDDDDAKHRYHQINHYHENLEYIDALSKKISVQYYTENMDILDIINFWLSKGAHEDDIAAAVMHLKYKKDDKELFKLMREVIEYRAD